MVRDQSPRRYRTCLSRRGYVLRHGPHPMRWRSRGSGVPACTDLITKPWVEEAGVAVLDKPFSAKGNVATAGGRLASQYLASWIIVALFVFWREILKMVLT